MGFGNLGRLPTGVMSRRISARASDYTVTRVTQSTNDAGEVTETESTHTVSLWCFEPRNVTAQWESGEHTSGSLQALSDPSADITFDDRLTHGGIEYEVDDVTMYPDETSPVYRRLNMVRRDGP